MSGFKSIDRIRRAKHERNFTVILNVSIPKRVSVVLRLYAEHGSIGMIGVDVSIPKRVSVVLRLPSRLPP